MNAVISTTAVKMFANFSKGFFLPLTGDLDPTKPTGAEAIYAKLKEQAAGLSKHTVHALLGGTEKLVRGYEVVDVANHHVVTAAAKMPETGKTVRGPWMGYQPAGPVMAVRRGSVIAKGLEALKDGANMDQLKTALGHDAGETTMSFLSYRPKKRGYGIRFDSETNEYFLIMPEGQTEIVYK